MQSVGTQRNGASEVSLGKVFSHLTMKKRNVEANLRMKIGSRKEGNVLETTEPLGKVIGSLTLKKTSKTTKSDRGK